MSLGPEVEIFTSKLLDVFVYWAMNPHMEELRCFVIRSDKEIVCGRLKASSSTDMRVTGFEIYPYFEKDITYRVLNHEGQILCSGTIPKSGKVVLDEHRPFGYLEIPGTPVVVPGPIKVNYHIKKHIGIRRDKLGSS